MPLNSALYALLQETFGSVRVAREGEGMSFSYESDPLAVRGQLKMVVAEHGGGEYYCVNCPYCNDTRRRLYINHRWGVFDRTTGGHNLWLAVCYNDQCLSADPRRYYELFQRVWGFRNEDERNEVFVEPGDIDLGEPTEAAMPGDWYHVADLDPSYPAFRYLALRGYDVRALAREWELGLCVDALPKYRTAQDRIIIPLKMDGVLVGWQARYPGDLDWKAAGVPKYYSMPRMPRRMLLYNFDRARTKEYCVLVEGPTSAWQVGEHAVATLGKSVSTRQLQLLCSHWGTGAIVVLFDGDAAGVEASQEVVDALRGRARHVVQIALPAGKDPGNFSHDYLQDLIHNSAATAGVDLTTLKREVPQNERDSRTQAAGAAPAGAGDAGVQVGRPGRALPPPGRVPFFATHRP